MLLFKVEIVGNLWVWFWPKHPFGSRHEIISLSLLGVSGNRILLLGASEYKGNIPNPNPTSLVPIIIFSDSPWLWLRGMEKQLIFSQEKKEGPGQSSVDMRALNWVCEEKKVRRKVVSKGRHQRQKFRPLFYIYANKKSVHIYTHVNIFNLNLSQMHKYVPVICANKYGIIMLYLWN